MRLLNCFLFMLCSSAFTAQIDLSSIQEIDCGGETISVSTDWDVYQTFDNMRDGLRDTTICIPLLADDGMLGIRSNDVDIARPVFMRYVGEDVVLQENWGYMLGIESISYDSIIDFANTDFCNEGFCHGSLMDIRIPAHPDSLDQYDRRVYTSEFGHFPETDYDVYCSYTHCIPTEYFDSENVLQDVVLKFIFRDDFNGIMDFNSLFVQPIDYIENLEYMLYHTTQFDVITDDWGYGVQPLLGVRPPLTYPNVYEYVDISPQPNVDTVATVSLTLTEFNYVLLQPYLDFRGGLVEGSDERHVFEMINNGATICMNSPLIEVQFQEKDAYIHLAGELEFRAEGSCMMFLPESRLEVGESVQMTYGTDGQGTLALAPGSTIELQTGSSFDLNARLVLIDGDSPTGSTTIDIEVPPFTSFSFSHDARMNDFTADGSAKLRFIMSGGTLDLGDLNEDELAEIEIVFKERPLTESIELLGNPVEESIRFRTQDPVGEYGLARVFDLQGRVIAQWKLESGRTYHQHQLPVSAAQAYILEVSDGVDSESIGFIRQ